MVTTRASRIPMSSLTALTLHSSRRTTSRRLPPVPQLTCRGKCSYQPDVVQCVKVGDDGAGGVEWKCEADLPKGLRFGEVEVGCEGWDGPDDPYILRGSCGLTYHLVRSSSALEDGPSLGDRFSSYLPSSKETMFSSLFNLLFVLASLFMLYSFLRSLFPSSTASLRFRLPRIPFSSFWPGSGGGGGGGSGPRGPPPPYTPKPEEERSSSGAGAGWRPGFWSGLAAGAAASELRNRAMYRPTYTTYAPAMGPTFGGARGGGAGTFWPSRGGGGVGGWGGGGNLREWDDDDRGVGTSASGGMRSSTGFGGTRNR
ncbi:hypothetical protein JCM5296_005765 [Sporobolomyces johnsonii]